MRPLPPAVTFLQFLRPPPLPPYRQQSVSPRQELPEVTSRYLTDNHPHSTFLLLQSFRSSPSYPQALPKHFSLIPVYFSLHLHLAEMHHCSSQFLPPQQGLSEAQSNSPLYSPPVSMISQHLSGRLKPPCLRALPMHPSSPANPRLLHLRPFRWWVFETAALPHPMTVAAPASLSPYSLFPLILPPLSPQRR